MEVIKISTYLRNAIKTVTFVLGKILLFLLSIFLLLIKLSLGIVIFSLTLGAFATNSQFGTK